MTVTVRPMGPDAAGAAHAVIAAAHPYLVVTPEVLAWQAATAPPAQRYRVLLAYDEGVVTGVVRCGVDWETSVPGQGFANVSVRPASRGRGAGAALLAAAEAHVRAEGARTVFAWVSDDAASRRFAARKGYRERRSASYQRLDLSGLPAVPAVPDGVEVRECADFADPRPLWEADVDASRDEPGETPVDAMDYDGWLATVWRRPDLDRRLSLAAVVDGTVAAFTLVQTDPPRYWSGMSGSRRRYRGRGLVKLVKAASLRAAWARGLTEAYTGNDGDNAPMLAINAWLGYRPYAVQWRYRRELG